MAEPRNPSLYAKKGKRDIVDIPAERMNHLCHYEGVTHGIEPTGFMGKLHCANTYFAVKNTCFYPLPFTHSRGYSNS